MKRKYIYLILLSLLMIYPAYFTTQVGVHMNRDTEAHIVEKLVNNYQLSIWITWILLVSIAVYQKWTTQKNGIFYFTYAYLLITNAIFGYYMQQMVTIFEIKSRFSDTYSLGVFMALQYFVAAALLTAFLQVGAWWFTRRWHRR